MKVLLILVLVTLTYAISNQPRPGLRSRVNKAGLNTLLDDDAKEAAENDPSTFVTLGKLMQKSTIGGLLTQTVSVQNVQAFSISFEPSESDDNHQLIPPNHVMSTYVIDSMTLAGNWELTTTTSLTFSGKMPNQKGKFTAQVSNLKFDYTVQPTSSTSGQFRVSVIDCTIKMFGSMEVEASLTNGNEYMRKRVTELLRTIISRRFCNSFSNAHEEYIKQKFAREGVMNRVGVGSVSMDNRIMGPITVDDFGVVVNMRGRCFSARNPDTGALDSDDDDDEDVFGNTEGQKWQLTGRRRMLQSCLDSFYMEDLFEFDITQDMVPVAMRPMFRTRMARMFIPGLDRYGDRELRLGLGATERPRISLNEDGSIRISGSMNIAANVVMDDGPRNALTMRARMNASLAISVKGNKVFSPISEINTSVSQVSSEVGDLPLEGMQELMNEFIPETMNSLNAFSSGFEVPRMLGLEYGDLSMDVKKGKFELHGSVSR